MVLFGDVWDGISEPTFSNIIDTAIVTCKIDSLHFTLNWTLGVTL